MNRILEQGLEILKIHPSRNQKKQLEDYISELLIWNKKLNLVGRAQIDDFIVRHVLDCLAGFEILNNIKGITFADVGSGGGLPGILISIFMEDKHVSLIERSGKKAGFLESTTAILGLSGRINVINKNIEEVNEKFDVVVLRAFRDFSEYYRQILSVRAKDGCIAAYKGRLNIAKEDISRAKADATKAEIKKLDVPFLNEERCILLLR